MSTHRRSLLRSASVLPFVAVVVFLGGSAGARAQVIPVDLVARLDRLEHLADPATIAQIGVNTTGLATLQGGLQQANTNIAGNSSAIAGLSTGATALRADLGSLNVNLLNDTARLDGQDGVLAGQAATLLDQGARLGAATTALAGQATTLARQGGQLAAATGDVAALRTGLGSLGANVLDNTMRLDGQATTLLDQGARLGAATTALAGQATTLARQGGQLVAATGDIVDLRADLGTLNVNLLNNAVRLDGGDGVLAGHTATLRDHETRITTNTINIANNTAALARQGDRITANTGDIAAVRVDVNVNAGLISGLRQSIDAAGPFLDQSATLANHETRITDLRRDTDENGSRIAALGGVTRENTERLADHGAILNRHEAAITKNTRVGAENSWRIDSDERQLARHGAAIGQLQRDLGEEMGSLRQDLDRQGKRIDTATEGVAMALAMKTPAIPDGKTFALSGGFGAFEGRQAFAMSGGVRATEAVEIDGGFAVGLNSGSVGGRAGATIAW